MLNVIKLSVIMMSVVAPFERSSLRKSVSRTQLNFI
jgi:hypothetical protein